MMSLCFDFAALSPRERYKLLIGTVVPRPIALVTTVDARGVVNAAPFSFFNCLSADPPILALGVENEADMGFKDTAANIRVTEEFTVNIVSHAMLHPMNVCAVDFPSHVDELREAGLTAVPGTMIAPPRIGEAPAALECRRFMTLEIGRSRQIILGQVLCAHYRDDVIDADRLHVDQLGLDALGRMGGNGYSRTRDLFDLKTPSEREYRQMRA